MELLIYHELVKIILKKKCIEIFVIFFFFILGISSNAFSYSLKECLEISDVVNADVPQRIDPMTDLISTHCKVGPSLPTFKPILNGMKGIELDYFNKKGKFIDKVQFSNTDC